jgi:hypothetical protein
MTDRNNTFPQVLAVLIPLLLVVAIGFSWPAWTLGAMVVAFGCWLTVLAFLKNRPNVMTAGLCMVGLACGLGAAFLLRQ